MQMAPNRDEFTARIASMFARDTVDAAIWDFDLNSHKFTEVLTHWICETKPVLREALELLDAKGLQTLTFAELRKGEPELFEKLLGGLRDVIRYGGKV